MYNTTKKSCKKTHPLSRWHNDKKNRKYRIYGVDFDGTLYIKGRFQIFLGEVLNVLQNKGDIIILYTTRVGKELDEAIKICEQNGLFFDDIAVGKPYCDCYIDDISVNADEFINQISIRNSEN